MSWQSYIDGNLMVPLGTSQKTMTGAAILGQADGAIWASSAGFPSFNPAEAVALASKVTNPEGTAKFAGVNYIVINSEPGLVLRGRKGSTGIIISKTQTALVIGLYDNNDVLPGDASKCVETIGEYLASNGI